MKKYINTSGFYLKIYYKHSIIHEHMLRVSKITEKEKKHLNALKNPWTDDLVSQKCIGMCIQLLWNGNKYKATYIYFFWN